MREVKTTDAKDFKLTKSSLGFFIVKNVITKRKNYNT